MSDCVVCFSPYNVEISSMLACGADAETIATTTGLDVNAVESHIAKCCAAPVPDDSPDSLEKSDQRLRALASKIAAAGTASGLAGDAKSLLTALAIELRVETALRERLEKQEEKNAAALPLDSSGNLLPPPGVTKYIDSVLEARENRPGDAPESRWFGMGMIISKHPDGDRLLNLFWQLLHDQPLLTSVLQTTESSQPEIRSGVILAGVTPGAN
jgi:hypothetical protein